MAEKLEVIITATDEATGVLKGIGGALSSLGGLAGGALTLGLGAATAAVGALGAGLAISLHEAMNAEEVQARLAAVIRSTGGASGVTSQMAQQLATQFRDLAGGSDEAIKSIEEIGIRSGAISADQMPKFIQTVADLGAVTGDTAGAATLLARAQEDPIAALGRLNRSGIIFSETLKAQIQDLAKHGDAAGATALIMDRVAEATAGAAAAQAGTFSGQLEIMKNHLLEIGESIGSKLLPLLEQWGGVAMDAIDKVAGLVQPFLNLLNLGIDPLTAFKDTFATLLPADLQTKFDGAIKSIQTVWGYITSIYEAVRTIVTGDFRGGIFGLQEDDPIVTTLLQIHDLIAVGIPGAISSLKGLSISDFVAPDVMTGIGNLIGALQASGPQVQAAGDAIVKSLEDAGVRIQAAFAGVTGAAGPTATANLATALNSLADLWRAHGGQVIGIITAISTAFNTTFGQGIAMGIGVIGAALAILSGTFSATMQVLQGNWQGAWTTIQASALAALNAVLIGAGTNMDQLKLAVGRGLDAVTAFIRTKIGEFVTLGQDIIAGFTVGINLGASGLLNAMVGAVQSAIAAAKAAAGISSPSQVFAEMGRNMMAGLAEGIQGGLRLPQVALTAAVPVLAGTAANAGSVTNSNRSLAIYGDIHIYPPDSGMSLDTLLSQAQALGL